MTLRTILIILCLSSILSSWAQTSSDSTAHIEGWTFGGLPVVAYNADFGLQYGALANFFFYGDQGIRYPYYDHSIYLEYTNTTRGESKFKMRYDARELIREVRFRVDLEHKKTLYKPFYGFNGYQSFYDGEFLNPNSNRFISQLFYSYEQEQLTASARAEKNLRGKQLRVQTEMQLINTSIYPVDRDRFNEGKSLEQQAPDTSSLYEYYTAWGIIPQKDQSGGTYMQLGAGGIVDTRDIEPFPASGLWEELSLSYGIPLDGVARSFVSLRAIHRHYLTLLYDRLILAHRIQYSTYLTDDIPFYQLHWLGGNDNLRGIKYNRLIGAGVAGATAELRWKVFKMVIFNQNLYAGLNLFFDTGMVTKQYKYSQENVPNNYQFLFDQPDQKLHHATGIGLKGALNENFVISIDYGRAMDARDGNSGMYIGLNWQF